MLAKTTISLYFWPSRKDYACKGCATSLPVNTLIVVEEAANGVFHATVMGSTQFAGIIESWFKEVSPLELLALSAQDD